MSDDLTTMYADSKRAVQYAMNEAMSELQRARLDGDRTAAAEAVLKVNDISIRDQNLDRLYAQARQQPQQRGPASKYGLSPDETEIAHGLTYGGKIDKDEAEKRYAIQKQRYREMRASGEYRDDQGRITR